jgi:hypothetical protein
MFDSPESAPEAYGNRNDPGDCRQHANNDKHYDCFDQAHLSRYSKAKLPNRQN